ncbi:MAG: hypothetical protein ACYDHP_04980 [Ferrimicrobium sp.]
MVQPGYHRDQNGTSLIGTVIGVSMGMLLIVVITTITVGVDRWLILNAWASQGATAAAQSLAAGTAAARQAGDNLLQHATNPAVTAASRSWTMVPSSVTLRLVEPAPYLSFLPPLSATATVAGP